MNKKNGSPVKMLAIETATSVGGTALFENGRLLAEYRCRMPMAHAERLMVLVDQVLQDSGVRPSEVGALVLSAGPGSFTGLRVGINTAKGFAGDEDLDVVAVSTLETLAGNLNAPGHLCCPMMDAKKGEVYTALFRCGVDGFPERITKDRVLTVDAAVDEITGRFSEKVIFLGDGTLKYQSEIQAKLNARGIISPEELSHPSPAVLGRLGYLRLERGDVTDIHTLEPVYLRRSEAEVTWDKGVHLRGPGFPVPTGKIPGR